MNLRILRTLAIATALGLLLPGPASLLAQPYAIAAHSTAPGGTSAGGRYALTGTIAQPEAGTPLVGGTYAVTGGLLALPIAVQTPGAPVLTIRPGTPGFATISWQPATAGYVLQESSSLTPAAWQNSASGAQNPTIVGASLTRNYYRLNKP